MPPSNAIAATTPPRRRPQIMGTFLYPVAALPRTLGLPMGPDHSVGSCSSELGLIDTDAFCRHTTNGQFGEPSLVQFRRHVGANRPNKVSWKTSAKERNVFPTFILLLVPEPSVNRFQRFTLVALPKKRSERFRDSPRPRTIRRTVPRDLIGRIEISKGSAVALLLGRGVVRGVSESAKRQNRAKRFRSQTFFGIDNPTSTRKCSASARYGRVT